MAKMLSRMCLTSTTKADEDTILVRVPPTRHDILHPCDIYEDVAVAYGYNNIKYTLPKAMTIGKQVSI